MYDDRPVPLTESDPQLFGAALAPFSQPLAAVERVMLGPHGD